MLRNDFDSLTPTRDFSRRAFVQTAVGSGFAAAVLPVTAQTMIKTDTDGLVARASRALHRHLGGRRPAGVRPDRQRPVPPSHQPLRSRAPDTSGDASGIADRLSVVLHVYRARIRSTWLTSRLAAPSGAVMRESAGAA